MHDIRHWFTLHEAELHELAERTRMHDDTVHFITMLVLQGWTDAAIYEQLHEMIPSPDGQHNPLAETAELLDHVRRLVAS